MAFFELNSDISIGTYRFGGVHDVRIRKGIHGYNETAVLKLPAHAYGKVNGEVVNRPTGTFFEDGDPVIIKLGYNGNLRTEFEGFVRRRTPGLMMEVECEGYVRQLRLNKVNADLTKGVKAKALLEQACKGTDIKVQCAVDFTLYGRNFIDAQGTQLLDELKKATDRMVTIFFIEPRLLWCGLVYTEYLGGKPVFDLPTVDYRLGWNVVRDNELRERVPNEEVQVYMNGMLASGDAVRTASDEKVAKRKVKMLVNGLRETPFIKQVANEKMNQLNYAGYDGAIRSFLEPYVLPGYNAQIVDSNYKERTGLYLVESVETTFGVHGARRRVGIGPKLG